MSNIYELKKMLSAIYNLLDTIESNGGPDLGDNSLKEVFQVELHSFYMYLSASDGKITSEEKNFMNALFGTNMTIQDYVRFIDENDIYSTSFEEQLPLTFKAATIFDAKMAVIAALTGKDYKGCTPILIDFLLESGKAFIACDGDIDDQEMEDLHTYVGLIAERLTEALKELRNNCSESDEVGIVGKKKTTSKVF